MGAVALPLVPPALEALAAAAAWVGGAIAAMWAGDKIGTTLAQANADSKAAEDAKKAEELRNRAAAEPKENVEACPTCGGDDGRDNEASTGKQDKKLSKGEIDKLKKGGVDPHDLKPKKEGSKYDLFKNKKGDIVVKPKDGTGVGDPTGLNINNF